MRPYATLQDVLTLSGKEYTAPEQERISALLPLVCDALRAEARKAGRNLDDMIAQDESLESVAKLVTVDVILRIMRQSMTGEPISQESQSAMGYSWSGTYAVPGGGIAAAIMRNDLKRLGIRRQRAEFTEIYDIGGGRND